VWSHPLDVHFEFMGIQGWPRLSIQVWKHDSLGRSYLGGYGFCPLPMSPGNHKIDVDIWRPIGDKVEELTAKYIGGSPILRQGEMAHRSDDRFKIKSESAGVVHIEMNLILGRTSNFPIAF
jgi:B9 domain-containing protein 2